MRTSDVRKIKSNHIKLFITISVIIIISTLLRLYLLIGAGYIVDGDEALVGIQAIHYTQFKTLHPFVYGQDYMGSLQSLTAAFFFFLFGVSSITLKLVPVFYYILFKIIYFFFALKYFNKNIALLSLLILSFPGLALNRWTIMPTGGHIENLFLSILMSYIAYNILYNNKNTIRRLYLFSFIAGLAFWTHPFSIFLIIVYTFFIIIKLKPTYKTIFKNVFFFGLGSLPLWIYNFFNGFITFLKLAAFFLGIRASTAESVSLLIIIKNVLTKIFYLFTNIGNTFSMIFEIFGFEYNIYFLLYFGLIFIYLLLFLLFKIIKQKDYSHKLFPLLIFFFIYLFIIGSSSRAPRDRYLLPFYIVFPIIFSFGIDYFIAKYLKLKVIGLIIVSLYAFINIQVLFNYVHNNYENVRTMFDSRKNVINFLVYNNISYAYSGHYTAFPLSFLSKEKIIISPKAGFYNEDRIKYYSELVDNSTEPKAVLFNLAIGPNNRTKAVFINSLAQKKIIYDIKELPPYYIFFNFSENIIIDEFSLPVRFR